jgi:long-chain acyl-CoA synthetase
VLTYKWDPARALELIEREQVTNFSGVPTMSRELLQHPDWSRRDTSSLRGMGGGGAALQPDLVDKIDRSLGHSAPSTGYGLTETHGIVTANSSRFFLLKPASCGPVMPTLDAKLVDDAGEELPAGPDTIGQLCLRGPVVIKGYLNRPDATAESIDREGYFHSGDAGVFDPSGQLRIIDRAKDVGQLANGAMFAPNYIENKLKFFPHIKEAVAFGNHRDMVCAFVNIDVTAVGNWAERQNIPYSGYADLAGKPQVAALIKDCVEKVNAELAGEGELAHSQVHRFLILHKELDPDDDELTRTRKVRRGFISEKYAALVDALYGGRDVCHVETQMKFEDGRVGTVAADVRIHDARTVSVQPMRHAA